MRGRLLHLLFPDLCASCDALLDSHEAGLCSACRELFDPFPSPLESEMQLRLCIASRYPASVTFQRGWCRYLFHKKSTLQRALHAMKYDNLSSLATLFGRELGEWMAAAGDGREIDTIVPVPLHRLKLVERGYNQAECIARGIASALQKPVRTRLLQRCRPTMTQTGLAAAARRRNLEGAFRCRRAIPRERFLLVDDVITTGATMADAARALLEGGAASVSLASVALAAKE